MNRLIRKVIDLFRLLLNGEHYEHDFIYAVGNSHTRAFSYNANFFPMFIGSGKTHSLIDGTGLENLKLSLDVALKSISNQKVMLVLGEPDARYCLGKGWYPWEGKVEFLVDDFRPLVDASFVRYKQLIQYLKSKYKNTYMILNVTPVAAVEENLIVNYFNDLLRTYCASENLVFIEINEKLYTEEGYVDPQYLGDSIHLNNKIQPLVEDFLLSRKLIQKPYYQQEVDWDHAAVQGKYKFSKKFGCYVIQHDS
jgi:lysophospholipase L1-like esterase